MNEETERWKSEYRDLVREHEQSQQDADDLQQQLRQLLRQCLSSCMGWRANIDEEIEVLQIRIDKATDAKSLLSLQGIANEVSLLVTSHRKENESTMTIAVNQLTFVRDEFVQSLRAYPAIGERLRKIIGNDETELGEQFALMAREIIEVCRGLERERNDTEHFLSEVRESLISFEQWATQSAANADGQRAASNALEQEVSSDVNALTDALSDDRDDASIKTLMREKLRAIGQRISGFRANEEQRLNEMAETNATLQNELKALHDKTERLNQQLHQQQSLLLKDTLTQVHSRFAYDERLAESISAYARGGEPFCYSLWDIDRFKAINDSLGHQAGDALLKQIAGYLKRYTRTSDFVARIGGEEFVILLPSITIDNAMTIADKLRAIIGAAQFEFNGEQTTMSISCGITEVIKGDTVEGIYERADKALYEAKNGGRNRCIAA